MGCEKGRDRYDMTAGERTNGNEWIRDHWIIDGVFHLGASIFLNLGARLMAIISRPWRCGRMLT